MPDVFSFKTPCFVFDETEVRANLTGFRRALNQAWSDNAELAYSVKTNPLPWVLSVVKDEGCLAEVVSDQEYLAALSAGFAPDQIVFNGPIKGRECFCAALAAGSLVNIDSQRELQWLQELAAGNDGAVSVGIRVNFDLERFCPGQTLTGAAGGRFGFCYENGELARAIEVVQALSPHVRISGLHMHVTTQARSTEVYTALARMAATVIGEFGLDLDFIDLGGGFYGGGPQNVGAYELYAEAIARVLCDVVDPAAVKLVVEPGGAVICTPARYLGRVIDVKDTTIDRFVVTELSRVNIDHEQKKTSYVHKLHASKAGRVPIFGAANKSNTPEGDFCDTDRSVKVDKSVKVGSNVVEASEGVYLGQSRAPLARQVICGFTCMESDRLCVLEDEMELGVGDIVEIRNAGAYSLSFSPSFFIQYPPAVYAVNPQGEAVLVREPRSGDIDLAFHAASTKESVL